MLTLECSQSVNSEVRVCSVLCMSPKDIKWGKDDYIFCFTHMLKLEINSLTSIFEKMIM